MTYNDNGKKSQSGWDFQTKVCRLCQELQDKGLIKRFSHSRTSDVCHHFSDGSHLPEAQYRANYTLVDLHDSIIYLYTSTSFRTDRIKSTMWDAYAMQFFSGIHPEKVAAVIFIVEDAAANEDSFLQFKAKLMAKSIYSPISHAMSESEFLRFMDQWEQEKTNYVNQCSYLNLTDADTVEFLAAFHNKAIIDCLTKLKNHENGSGTGKRGNAFEEFLRTTLSNEEILEAYQNEVLDRHGKLGKVLTEILDCSVRYHNIDIQEVASIECERSIALGNHGLAKPDLKVVYHMQNNQPNVVSYLSLKLSSGDVVTCHDYTADSFIEVLNLPNESLLAEGLKIFQENGNWKNTKIAFETKGLDFEKFQEYLKQAMPSLLNWALKGQGHTLPKELEVDLMVLARAEELQVRATPADDYIRELLALSKNSVGAPLNWTYPSKQRGKRIQLKMPLRLS